MPAEPVFLLQNNYYDQIGRLIQPCLDFCNKHGYPFIDRSLTDAFNPDKVGIELETVPGVVIYGSVGWVKRCAASGLARWAFYDSQRFAATSWVPVFERQALNGDGEVQSLVEVVRRLERGERVHIRPNKDDKAFNGAAYDSAAWDRMLMQRRERQQNLPQSDLQCWVSPIKEILAEYRCWFVGGELIDVSMYRNNGDLFLRRETSDEILRAASDLAAHHLPIGNIVMDIARTRDGFKVIEFNPINSSGWYAASTGEILSRWCETIAH
jgi:hypothetical protein